MAVHSSSVEPLPHQIAAVYESLLPRQPLRFVLADDPGAGKTIMAGLYIRELIMRADAHRIVIVAPSNLVEQWRDELCEKFGLEFYIYSAPLEQTSPSGNPFNEFPRLIVRLDQIARNEELQEQLCTPGWDLAVFGKAHKIAAHYSGSKLKKPTAQQDCGRARQCRCHHYHIHGGTHRAERLRLQALGSVPLRSRGARAGGDRCRRGGCEPPEHEPDGQL